MTDELKNAIRQSRAKYQREWRKKNPDKAKEYNDRYWERRVLKEMENANNGNTTYREDKQRQVV